MRTNEGQAKKRLNEAVENLIMEHEGGYRFFDALDQHIREEETYFNLLLEKVGLGFYFSRANVIVSGKFGKMFRENAPENIRRSSIYWVKGSLRKGVAADLEMYGAYHFDDATNVFIDDSFYSGKTRDVISEALEKIGARLSATYVVYDGSPEQDGDVTSLYRYYDHHKKW